MEIRGTLEGTAARLATERLGSNAELETLRKYQAERMRSINRTWNRFLHTLS
jgi:DNA-binding GntR family transcriptional regulator